MAKCSEWRPLQYHRTTPAKTVLVVGELRKNHACQRTHQCPHCGFVLDRDWNAARNILELGLRTVGHTGTLNASGDIDLCLGEETPSSKSGRRKRKSKQ